MLSVPLSTFHFVLIYNGRINLHNLLIERNLEEFRVTAMDKDKG